MSAVSKIEEKAFHSFSAAAPQTTRPAGESTDFRWDNDILVHVVISSNNCSVFNTLLPDAAASLKEHLIKFSQEKWYSARTFKGGVRSLCMSFAMMKAGAFDMAWAVKALGNPSIRANIGFLRSFFVYWKERYDLAIDTDALQVFARLHPRAKRSLNVLSDDPEVSWLTNLEFDALLQRTWDYYDQGLAGTQVTLLRLLSMQYARRPVQFANLKIGDFHETSDGSAVNGRSVHFPGAKDRNAEKNFRDSKTEVHPIADHLWDLFQIQKQEARQLCESVFGFSLTDENLSKLPVFLEKVQLVKAIDELTNHYHIDWRFNLGHQLFHTTDFRISRYLAWHPGMPMVISENSARRSSLYPPLSHRTGRPIHVTATRMRHTIARQLARLGMPKHILSFWLGHTYEKSLDAYYNDPAEEARKINESMGGALIPLAMSFTGKLLDDESQASRAEDSESTLEFAGTGYLATVGKCGKHSFCATTSVPVPCYRCKHFEPLVHAPHHEVLDALLQRQADENAMIKIGGSRKLLTPIDLSPDIRAVQACIERCNARKAELGEQNG